MNNKSDKKHKRKQKQKQTKHKKKTTSRQSKKKTEIKGGGKGWFKGLFSRNTPESKMTQQQSLNNTASSASPISQSSVYSQNPQPQTNQVSSNGSYNPTTKNPPNKNKWKNPKTLAELQQPLLPKSNRLANAQPMNSRNPQLNVSQAPAPANSRTPQLNVSQTQLANLRNSQQNVSQAPANARNPQLNVSQAQSPPPPPPPNAQPTGFKTIESQSRCSIM